ncbi:MAG: tetraacyldisaccharide 4'-kinase [Roseibium sp.]
MTKAPDFWWTPSLTAKAILLAPIGWLYGRITGRRMLDKPSSKCILPVICIGNFVVGGTGKTPFALHLAERLKEEGYRPGFLLRGYGGQETGPLLVDPEQHSSREVGDESLLLAPVGPTVIAADRPAGAKLLEQQPIDIVLMDDGFQNPALEKDLSLVLVDCSVGFGNGFCIPAGPLRAPADKQVLKTDCLVLVGEGDAAEPAIHLAGRKGLPIIHARIVPEQDELLQDQSLFAFAGIGRPNKFYKTLDDMGLDVRKTRGFADHHAYSEADARSLIADAEAEGLQLVTTAKDMARLKTTDGELFHWLRSRTVVLEVKMEIEPYDRVIGLIRETLVRRGYHLPDWAGV